MIKKTKNPHELAYLVVDPHDGRISENIFQSDDFSQCLDVLEGYYDRTGRGRVDAVIATYDAEIICRRVVCDGDSIDEARRWAQARHSSESRIESDDSKKDDCIFLDLKSVRNYIDHEIARLLGKSVSAAPAKTQAPPVDDLKGLATREAFLW